MLGLVGMWWYTHSTPPVTLETRTSNLIPINRYQPQLMQFLLLLQHNAIIPPAKANNANLHKSTHPAKPSASDDTQEEEADEETDNNTNNTDT